MRGMSSRTTRTRARAMIFLFYNLPAVASSRFGLICVCPFSSSLSSKKLGPPVLSGRVAASRRGERSCQPARCAPLSVEYAVSLGNSDGDVVPPPPVVVVANSCDAQRARAQGMAAITARFVITRVAAVVLRVVEARESYWMFSTQRVGLGFI